MKFKKIVCFLFLFVFIFVLSGCSSDNMDNIDIMVTSYPNEYIAKKIYGNHASVESIYPDGVDIDTYKITKRKKKKLSNTDLFIYNGKIKKDEDLAFELLNINPNLKIIDSAYVLNYDYAPNELYLLPSQLLMMAQNIRQGLIEYSESQYLKDDINNRYNKLKVTLSELDATYRITFKKANNKILLTSNENLKYLKSYGLDVYVINDKTDSADISKIEEFVNNGQIKYIYSFEGEQTSTSLTNLLGQHQDLTRVYLYKIESLTDKQRQEKINYINLMNNNLDELKKELYQ